ncbi:response regulator transcription factor [Mucilaginibacter paludis]|uniref:Transcriptional regulator, LuxR family n=1 Tax=Mucilaginibacter paludis DSM 18603 TaxID=714943 RepID=H1Y7U1_9SPHI|nr:response regulator transcription factor [Mucilaginibacter paludis]EHQ30427.1 transcriptional regulator, LuxR family [Mucilaginibacter paludis DSM 18603]
MKTKKDLDFTYQGHLQNAWYASEVADLEDINNLLEQFKQFGNTNQHGIPLFYVIDYCAHQYLVMTDAIHLISGYHPRDFIESRLEKLIDVYHKDDFKIYNQEIFSRNLTFLKRTPQHLHNHYLFSNNFRVKRSDKTYAQVLQRSTYITSKETGLPLYSMGMVVDITDVKTDTVIVHSIEKMNPWYKEVVETNYFYPHQEEAGFTKREKGVLVYIAEGLSSKQIADKLNISENTIVNHKQNMLRKTNAKNVTELVVMAVRNRVI